MNEPSADWSQIGRYLAGESSPDEAAKVRRWLEEHPADAQGVAEMAAAAARAASERRLDVEGALRDVKAQTAEASRSPMRLTAFGHRVEMIAAAAAILLVAGVFLFRRVDVRQPPPEVGYSTGVGQRDSVTLDDGSMVLLGPATRIVVRARQVDLFGEAYFRVVHDASRPFIVRAGDAVIRDIGTEFSVHSDASASVRVVVQDGAVALMHASDSVTLHPGDVGVVAESGGVEANRGAATPDDLAWTRGQLVFRNASVSELAADLRRWYGVELRVTDSSLLRKHFTGTFETEAPRRAVEVIALALGARIEQRGDTMHLRPAQQIK